MGMEGPQLGKRLDEKEAQDEANMMRAKMGVNPETGGVADKRIRSLDGVEHYNLIYRGIHPERAVIAEDYDEAFKFINEMKQLAEEEPSALKVMAKIGRVIDKNPIWPFLVNILVLPHNRYSLETPEALKGAFDDAAEKLRIMKEKGDKLGGKMNEAEFGGENRSAA